MGAAHGHRLHFHGHSRLHRASPSGKLLALVGFMLVVVASPATWYPAFAGYAAVLAAAIGLSRVPPAYLLRRMVIEVPLVAFALALPFVAAGPRTEVLGLSVSEPGLTAAGGLVLKGTLGVLAALLLAATTEPDQILRGLQTLRLPGPLVQIMGLMVRYLDVVTADWRRMTVAMRARGSEPRSPRHWPALARALGALFVRSYERGERVHLAMLSRGYTGVLPETGGR